jgi:hypothetical protein
MLDTHMHTRENLLMVAKESRNKNSDAAFKTIFREEVTVFKKASRDLIIIFLFHKAA